MKAPGFFFHEKSIQYTCTGEPRVDPAPPGQDKGSTDAHVETAVLVWVIHGASPSQGWCVLKEI